jgi:hypothetical protein
VKTKLWKLALVVLMALSASVFLATAAPVGAPAGGPGKPPASQPQRSRSPSVSTPLAKKPGPQQHTEHVNISHGNPAVGVAGKSASSLPARQGRGTRFQILKIKFYQSVLRVLRLFGHFPTAPTDLVARRSSGSIQTPLDVSQTLFECIALKHVVDRNNVAVLGRNPEYHRVAKATDSSFFEIDPKLWNRLSATDQHAANMYFINELAKKKYVFRLASRDKNTTPRAALKENPNGSQLNPPADK